MPELALAERPVDSVVFADGLFIDRPSFSFRWVSLIPAPSDYPRTVSQRRPGVMKRRLHAVQAQPGSGSARAAASDLPESFFLNPFS